MDETAEFRAFWATLPREEQERFIQEYPWMGFVVEVQ